jgi:hypothetical protein
MSENYGADYIASILNSSAEIFSIVGTNIYTAVELPVKNADVNKFIICYKINNFEGAQEYFSRTWSIDCKSDDQEESEQLAYLVYSLFNRNEAAVNGKIYFSVVTVLPTIPPINRADVFNTPVQVLLRRK